MSQVGSPGFNWPPSISTPASLLFLNKTNKILSIKIALEIYLFSKLSKSKNSLSKIIN